MFREVRSAASLALLVDNDVDTREMYGEFLAFSGWRVEQAATADEAIEKAQRLRPDVITTDIGLPGDDDGCALCVRLKVDDRTKSIPVIAVTAWAVGGHVERARDAGCDAVLMKPCAPQELLAEIERLTTATAPQSLEARHQTELRILAAHPLNVLLEGTTAATEAMLNVVRPHIGEPLVWHPRHAPLQLPAAEVAGLILRDVSALTEDEQTRLLLWLGGTGARTQVVSTTEYSLFTLVTHGLFDAALYYRLNVLLLKVATAKPLRPVYVLRAEVPSDVIGAA